MNEEKELSDTEYPEDGEFHSVVDSGKFTFNSEGFLYFYSEYFYVKIKKTDRMEHLVV